MRWCPPITRIIREMSPDQPVEHAATLEDVRAEVLTPDQLNVAGVRRLRGSSAVDRGGWRRGRAGVFSQRTDARIRHPAGDRVAAAASVDGCDRAKARRWRSVGLIAGAVCGYGLAQLAGSYLGDVQNARSVADGGVCVGAADGGGDCVGAAGGSGGERGCDAGVKGGVRTFYVLVHVLRSVVGNEVGRDESTT